MSSPRFEPDADLDAQLRNVALPEDLLERLKDVGPREDQILDAVLCDVPLPAGFLARLQQIGHRPRRRLRGRQLAMAACLFVAAGLAYFALLYGFMRSTLSGSSPAPPAVADNAVPAGRPAQIERATTPAPLESDIRQEELALEPAPS